MATIKLRNFWSVFCFALLLFKPGHQREDVRQFGTESFDLGSGIAVDFKDKIYITGNTEGNLEGNVNAGGKDIFVGKYSSSVRKQWVRQIGTAKTDAGFDIAVDLSGYVYVTGFTDGHLDNLNAGRGDIFLVKYNSSGKRLWLKQLGTKGDDSGNGIAVDSKGNIYVTGSTGGNLEGKASVGGKDVFLVKYNSSGVKQWTRQIGSTSWSRGDGIAVDLSGNVYITGDTQGNMEGNINSGLADIIVVKFNSAGIKLWTRQTGTNRWDRGKDIATNSKGDIYITGFTGGDLDGNDNVGTDDIFIMKYNPLGDKQWTRQIGTKMVDNGEGIAIGSDGNVYITGDTEGSLEGNLSAGGKDIFVAKYSSLGAKLWIRQLGTIRQDSSNDIAIDSKDNVYVTGFTEGHLDEKVKAMRSGDIIIWKLSNQ